jgi:hypothetical protein
LLEVKRHPDELRDRGYTHLLHDMSAMDFHGTLTKAEFGRHDLVWFSDRQELQDFELPWRQRREPCTVAIKFQESGSIQFVGGERALDTVQQILFAIGFLHKVECTVLDGLYRHWNVAVPGDEYHGNYCASQIQLLLQLQATHCRHAHVKDQAAGLMRRIAIEKHLGGLVRGRCEAHRLEQEAEGVPRSDIVIYDKNRHQRLPGWFRDGHEIQAFTDGSRTMKRAPRGTPGL